MYRDPKTKQTYPSKEWMFANWDILPEVQAAYPDYKKKEKEPVKKDKAEKIRKQIEEAQAKLVEKQEELRIAREKESEEEMRKAQAEAEEYYKPYIEERKEEVREEATALELATEEDYQFQMDKVVADKQKLIRDYENYMEDIKTGKLRVGEDKQIAEARRLEQEKEFLMQHSANLKVGLENLQRGWIQRGGLFSGVRREAAQLYGAEAERERQRYLSASEYQRQQTETGYQRAMQDYLTKEQRIGAEYQAGLTDISSRESQYEKLKERKLAEIARTRIKDIRSLQEAFQEAVALRGARTLEEQYTR